ncbi:MAG: GDP-mannose 4,6-dehydratase [archaeon]|nr:GDP-mannose 4,6-dehydratase [archaeon]
MGDMLVLGGAGFIGSNAADRFLREGHSVTIFDNFSRVGTPVNAEWLKKNHPNVDIVRGDIRFDRKLLEETVKGKDLVLHMAAQIAMTRAVSNPEEDFDINVRGTMHVLEAMRRQNSSATLIFASTNKVYGKLTHIPVTEKEKRYDYKDLLGGVSENFPLEFNSIYACSKGACDQYVHDYADTYGMNSVVFRQSCIYGPRQFGIEEQGWLSWLTIASLQNKKITLYGNGKQVRDVLFIDDLVNAFELAHKKISKTKGQVYNVGGGPKFTLSLLELVAELEKHLGKKILFAHGDWRPGDQYIFVSDISKIKNDIGWEPKVGPVEGVKRLVEWTKQNTHFFPG